MKTILQSKFCLHDPIDMVTYINKFNILNFRILLYIVDGRILNFVLLLLRESNAAGR